MLGEAISEATGANTNRFGVAPAPSGDVLIGVTSTVLGWAGVTVPEESSKLAESVIDELAFLSFFLPDFPIRSVGFTLLSSGYK